MAFFRAELGAVDILPAQSGSGSAFEDEIVSPTQQLAKPAGIGEAAHVLMGQGKSVSQQEDQ